MLKRWTNLDEKMVIEAIAATGIDHLSQESVETLSGGQQQRVWISMVLAQETSILLLDEPTTYLDMEYQIELLELLHHLNRTKGYTFVVVLHDINQAFRYADQIVVMKQGEILASGDPKEIINPQLINDVFGLSCMITDDPIAHTPMVDPTQKTQ